MEHRKYKVVDPKNQDTYKFNYYGYPYPTNPISIAIYPYPVYKRISENKNIIFIPIYLTTQSEVELLYRLILRESLEKTPNYKEVARRFISDQKDFPRDYDTIVEEFKGCIFQNVSLDVTVSNIYKFIQEKIREVYSYGMP